MLPRPVSRLSQREIADLIRRAAEADPPAGLVVALHERIRADDAAVTDLLRCLVAAPPDVVDALWHLTTVASASQSHETPAEIHRFQCEGEYWTIAFAGLVVRLRDRRGLHYLARLLDRPGEPIRAEDLVAAASPDRASRSGQARLSVTKAIANVLVELAERHPALAAHLAATVRRGRCCRYTPDPRHPIRWII